MTLEEISVILEEMSVSLEFRGDISEFRRDVSASIGASWQESPVGRQD